MMMTKSASKFIKIILKNHIECRKKSEFAAMKSEKYAPLIKKNCLVWSVDFFGNKV